jgi:hypothetical protein
LTAIVFSVSLTTAAALADVTHEHEGDFIVGVSSGGQLTFEFDEHILAGEESIELPPIDPPSPGVYEGWAADEPGFDHLHDAEPAEDFYPLGSGADVHLVGVDLDLALYVRAASIGSPVAISPTPTLGSLQLGDEELHTHAIWHIDSLASGFDPYQTEWQGTFKLTDLGTTGYADSDPFTLTFTAVPEPASFALLALGSLFVLRRRANQV